MTTVFSTILDMGFHGSVTILLCLLFRLVFQKAPKSVTVAAWAICLVRLVCPITLTSAFSLMPTFGKTAQGTDGTLVLTVLEETLALPVASPIERSSFWMAVGAAVWCVGVAVMLGYTVAAYRRTHKTLREAVLLEGNVYECDRIPTPFIFGVFHPRIYLPSSMKKTDRQYVVAHESAHIARLDHIWKPLGFAVLALHWFNPLVWVAYVMFCRDMEAACDERVLLTLGCDCKKPYADALINCAAPTNRIAACPLAFGETDVKARVQTVLGYQQPSWWLKTVAMTAWLLIAVCFLTNPKAQALVPPAGEQMSPVTTQTTATRPTQTDPTLVQYTQKIAIESIAPRAVKAGDTVTVRVHVQDSRTVQSGVDVLLYREDEDGAFFAVGQTVTLTLVQGTASDGVYEGVIAVPVGTAVGDYRLRASYIPVSEKPAVCTAYTPEGEVAVTIE